MTLLINKSDTMAYILSCSLKMLNWTPSERVQLIFSILAKCIANNNNILNTVKISLQFSIFLYFLSYPSTNSFILSPIKELSVWCYNNTFILHEEKATLIQHHLQNSESQIFRVSHSAHFRSKV